MAMGIYMAANGTEKVGPATNMRKMEWNCSIQEKAQKYANRFENNCSLIHSHDGYGENIAGWVASFRLIPKIFGSGLGSSKSWANEFNTHGTRGLYYTYETGHATQMAWWNSDQMGCGVILCLNMTIPKEKVMQNRRLTVCNYWPPGNNGQLAFTVGPTFSDCGEGYKCDTATPTTGLCVKE